MEVQPFPEVENELFGALWRQQIQPLFNKVNEAKTVVDSHRPPTQDELETWIAKSNEPAIDTILHEIGNLERQITNLREELNGWALAELHSPANEDEKKAARQTFNRLKNQLVNSLHSLAHIAASESEQKIVDWVDTALTQVPKLNTTSNNHDLKEMRQWLQTHHPEADIKSRGTIPLKWKQVYYNRSE